MVLAHLGNRLRYPKVALRVVLLLAVRRLRHQVLRNLVHQVGVVGDEVVKVLQGVLVLAREHHQVLVCE